ncbi:MAG: hypothetical protein NC548_64160, partial [Lachnospiraceae bacterium]|nr:hypothetical protein [Lachnospiraceae bacterium]
MKDLESLQAPALIRDKMINKHIPILATALLSMACLSTSAAEIGFSYNSEGETPRAYGYTKPQIYDIGIALDSETVVGSKIISLSVPVFNDAYISDVKVWLSKELTTSKLDSKFTPDIASYDATVEDGVVKFVFPEPFEIPEDGVFLGYSFSCTDFPSSVTPAPVAVVDGNTPGGLWFHAETSQKRWADYSGRNNIVSAMDVTLDGTFPADKATAGVLSDHVYAAKGEPSTAKISVCNWGLNGISSVEYSYSINGVEATANYKFDTPVPAVLGRIAEFDAEVPAVDSLGEYEYEFKVTKVNGVECPSQSAVCPVTVQPFVAVYRPLVEEYTGRGCGWCPRGYVMLEQMNLYYGDRFVAMAYHNYNNDGMTCVESIPFSASGAPSCSFNRGSSIDPDLIPSQWRRTYENNTIADVQSFIEWADDSHSALKATARVRFIKDLPESDYLFSIALVADGLSNDEWGQSNAYADYNMSQQYESPYWDLFIGKGSPVMGLEYNDVVVYYKDMNGASGSLTESVEAEKWYEYTCVIPVEDVKTVNGQDVVSDFNKTRAISIVVNGKNGKPLNCASSIYPDGSIPEPLPSSVESFGSEVDVVDTLYFDMQGRGVANPAHGLYMGQAQKSVGGVTQNILTH